ncbi:CarD family transcriptional regulator [Algimonas ampicilliniresistens]|uniref:CarD family transcriptional regulator n=1 Tax=Algimonas ampicilliniresistens TaxID=1298735 RepID=A0ABQ5VDQ4_9PROT|nr:CarD family transcriptional regulator [Algimonas ampicilliniresistens]GLQ24809.1 CarD family transcriptional regulator [Algimonas ampicilliniresistens]
MATRKKSSSKKKKNVSFKVGQHIIYPAHGVGEVIGIEQEVIAGFDIEVYVVKFEQDKMTLRVPTSKAGNSGMRALSDDLILKDAFTTLKGRARVKRTMWSRRAQEYEAKINSGDLILVAEVVRDLHRTEAQPEQSYSERQLYERALDRMVREVAAIRRSSRDAAMEDIIDTLTKARTRQAAKAAKTAEDAEDNDNDDSEAAA